MTITTKYTCTVALFLLSMYFLTLFIFKIVFIPDIKRCLALDINTPQCFLLSSIGYSVLLVWGFFFRLPQIVSTYAGDCFLKLRHVEFWSRHLGRKQHYYTVMYRCLALIVVSFCSLLYVILSYRTRSTRIRGARSPSTPRCGDPGCST